MITPRLLFVALALPFVAGPARGDVVVNYNDLTLAANSYNNGSDLAGGFTSKGAFSNNSYDTTYNSWSGWSYSNVNNTTTAGYLNQYAAITGTAVGGGGIYAVADSYNPNDAFVNLPGGNRPVSMEVTNTTYAYLSMKDGDQFNAKFVAGDYMTLVITGYAGPGATGAATGTVNFDLARYTTNDDSPLSTWALVNLAGLGGAQSLGFSFLSSNSNAYGLTVPTYFAMDDLTYGVSSVPEPSALALAMTGLLGLILARKRLVARA